MLKVLIVDDAPEMRLRLGGLVSEVEGTQLVGEAADVPSALAALERTSPDVVLLDLQLPGGSGIDVLQRAKRTRASPTVIVLTAYATVQHRLRCQEAGADFFFEKGVHPDHIRDTLRLLAFRRKVAHNNHAPQPTPFAELFVLQCATSGPFERRLLAVREALAAEGFIVLAEIDMAAALPEAGLPRYRVINILHGAAVQRGLAVDATAPLLLSTRVAVWELDGGKVSVAVVDPVHLVGIDRGIALRAAAAAVSARLMRVMARIS